VTLETKEDPPQDPLQRIAWHTRRAWTFYTAARHMAVSADEYRESWRRSVGQRSDTNSLTDADRNCDNDPVFKGYVDAQQLYDRWFVRESSAVQMLIAVATYHREHIQGMPPPGSSRPKES
jgi:hypothetical protein